MKKNKSILLILIFFNVLISCSSSSEEGTEQQPNEQGNPPAKTVGTLPANGEPCSEYEEVSNDETKISVPFRWNSAQFAQSYLLVVSEGTNEILRNPLSDLQADAILDRGKTYTWRVISVNGNGQTDGDTFSFTTPGTPIGNFAPYAAEITVNFDSVTSEMTVSWVGSDEDGDTLTYDVGIFEEDESIFESFDLAEIIIDPITFVPSTNYVIEVISRDTAGNFSISRLSTISLE